MEESEDERQYMMLRHSDDEATNGNNGGNSEEAVAVKGEDVAEAADSHVIPKRYVSFVCIMSIVPTYISSIWEISIYQH